MIWQIHGLAKFCTFDVENENARGSKKAKYCLEWSQNIKAE